MTQRQQFKRLFSAFRMSLHYGRLGFGPMVATQAQNLCNFMHKSLDVGPSQFTNPRQEAWHWRALQDALAEFNKLASVAAQAKE